MPGSGLFLFHSRATAHMPMLAAPARRLLGIIGKPPQPGQASGIITAQEAPQAIAALLRTLEGEENPQDETNGNDDKPAPVTLRQRATPLIDMLRRSAGLGCNVVWEVLAG